MTFEPVTAPSALIDQVHDRLVDAIADGTLPPGQRLTQEEIAARLGVSRQPVSHALQVLRRRGLLEEAGKRGLIVAPLDAGRLRGLYQVRAVLEGLAASLAATRMQAGLIAAPEIDEGNAILARGNAVAQSGALADLIDADVAFHSYVHRLSGNDSIVDTVAEQWPQFRRSMGAVLNERPVRCASGPSIVKSSTALPPARQAPPPRLRAVTSSSRPERAAHRLGAIKPDFMIVGDKRRNAAPSVQGRGR